MGETINANGIDITYQFDGPADAPVVMLSNSLATNYSMWDKQIPALTQKYRVLRYDQRGHGGTQATEPPYSFDGLRQDAVALIGALGLDKVHFCGLSMGGMIGQQLGAKNPEVLHSLTLCDTASQLGVPGMWEERINMAREGGMPSLVDPTLQRWFTEGFRANNAAELEPVAEMIKTTASSGAAWRSTRWITATCCRRSPRRRWYWLARTIRRPRSNTTRSFTTPFPVRRWWCWTMQRICRISNSRTPSTRRCWRISASTDACTVMKEQEQ
jgi:3-oxoadipate enol-lactonase